MLATYLRAGLNALSCLKGKTHNCRYQLANRTDYFNWVPKEYDDFVCFGAKKQVWQEVKSELLLFFLSLWQLILSPFLVQSIFASFRFNTTTNGISTSFVCFFPFLFPLSRIAFGPLQTGHIIYTYPANWTVVSMTPLHIC